MNCFNSLPACQVVDLSRLSKRKHMPYVLAIAHTLSPFTHTKIGRDRTTPEPFLGASRGSFSYSPSRKREKSFRTLKPPKPAPCEHCSTLDERIAYIRGRVRCVLFRDCRQTRLRIYYFVHVLQLHDTSQSWVPSRICLHLSLVQISSLHTLRNTRPQSDSLFYREFCYTDNSIHD